jgi:hypothetical protein
MPKTTECTVKNFTLCTCVLLTTLALASPQHHDSGYPQPPAPADAGNTIETHATSPSAFPRTEPIQLQREAKELLDLSQSVQPDIASVTRGVLPKDTLNKLKRIEKLSKRLRSELSR